MFDRWVTYLVLLVVLVLVIYLIALSVATVVDHKIGDIKIQMPKIQITPQIYKEAFENTYLPPNSPPTSSNTPKGPGEPDVNDLDSDRVFDELNETFQKPNVITHKQTVLIPQADYTTRVAEQTALETLTGKKRDISQPPKTKKVIGCTKDSDCNIVNGDGKNVCKSDGTCHCLSGSGLFCQYGPTNYKDPKDMTPEELDRFKYKYRNNFTLQDYKNWLMLYKDDAQHLRHHHRENLKILLRGGQLTERDLPAIRIKPPMDPADYFQKMYEGGKISVHFPEESATGAMLGYNYSDFGDFIPPEKAENTWITGVVDLYKQPHKDDAKALNFYLRPEVTVGVERELVGEEYQNWVKKHHNLSDIRQIHERKDVNKSLLTFEDNDQNVPIDSTINRR